MVSNLEAMAFNLIAMVSNLEAMAFNLIGMVSNLEAMASSLEAMAFNLKAMDTAIAETLGPPWLTPENEENKPLYQEFGLWVSTATWCLDHPMVP